MKKTFMPLLGAVVLGMSAYAGYRTYDAYNGVNESDLLLANAEALAGPDEGPKCDNKNGCKSWKLNPVFDSRKGFMIVVMFIVKRILLKVLIYNTGTMFSLF